MCAWSSRSPAVRASGSSAVRVVADQADAVGDQLVLITLAPAVAASAVLDLPCAFAREQASLVINYRHSRAAAEALAAGIGPDRARAVHADVTDPAEVGAMFAAARAAFGRPVTTVVNNALASFSFNGDARSGADAISWDEFAAQLEGSVKGALNTTQAALPGLREQGYGRIVNIGTNLFQNPVVPYHDYTAAKAALLSLTRALAADLGPDGVTVNMVSGGLLRTTDASAATPDAVFDLHRRPRPPCAG